MKKHVQKLLAGVIALAMILGNLAGTGVTVVRAASDTLTVVVTDENNQPVSGLQLILISQDGEVYNKEFPVTDAAGKAIYETEGDEMGKYYIGLASGSAYTCEVNNLEVVFGQNGIEKVGQYEYNGTDISFAVHSTGGGSSTKADIESAAISLAEVKRGGDNAVVTVTGTSLPDQLSYQIWYYMKTTAQWEAGTIQTIAVSGDATQKTFNVKFPSASEYPKAISWFVRVSLPGEKESVSTGAAGIVKDTATGETEAIKVAIAGKETLVEKDYTVKSWKAYSAAIDEAESLYENVEATEAQCRAALQQIEKTKAALILIKDLATAATKASLASTLKEASELKETDYTAASWKAYSAAVNAGKALAADEDATEVRCQAAIKQIKDAKAALVKKAKVTKITISGPSKSIAVGKSVQLTAKVSPAKAANKAVKWTVSNKKYATVTSKGKVTVKKAGAGKTVTVTATAKDGSKKKATYRIKIMKDTVKSIKLKAAKTVKAGKNVKVTATVKTTGKKANKTLQWKSSNSKYATVSTKGVVKTKKAGKNKTVKITAKATDGSNKKYTVKIKIK